MNSKTTSDHDLLTSLNIKVDRLILDLKELKTGSTQQLLDDAKRLEKLEQTFAKFPPEELVPRFLIVEQQIHDLKVLALAWRTIGGLIGGAIFYILTQLPNWLKLVRL